MCVNGRLATWSADCLRGSRTYREDHGLDAVDVSAETVLKTKRKTTNHSLLKVHITQSQRD